MTVPTLDLRSNTFAADLLDACRAIGFASVVGHGINPAQFVAMRSMAAELFALPEEVKQSQMITPANYRGHIPLGFFTPNRAEVNGVGADEYEGWKLHWECPPDHPVQRECRLYGPNIWAPGVPRMAPTVLTYWAACSTLADTLMAIFARGLGVDPETLAHWHEAPLTNMTLLHYPATSNHHTGIHPHKDTNVITLLHPDPVGGLEVRQRDGSWISATSSDTAPDAILMNIGEMLELWSGGEYVATPHRVINSSGQQRYSFPWFLVPNHAVTVEPLVPNQPGFGRAPMPVGDLSAEVWRTNWPDEQPSAAGHDLGSLDR